MSCPGWRLDNLCRPSYDGLPFRRGRCEERGRERETVSCCASSSLPTPGVTGNILVQWPATAEGHAAQSPSETLTLCVCVWEILREGLIVHINSGGEKRRESTQSVSTFLIHPPVFLQTIHFPREYVCLSNFERHLIDDAARHVGSSSGHPPGI